MEKSNAKEKKYRALTTPWQMCCKPDKNDLNEHIINDNIYHMEKLFRLGEKAKTDKYLHFYLLHLDVL